VTHPSEVLTPQAPPSTARAPSAGSLRRLLRRPEAGSIAGAIVVFIFFLAMAPPLRSLDSLSTVLYQTSTIGIPATGVALLMIGGEFDLSAGVAVITSSLTASMFAFQFTTNVWVGVVVALVLSLLVGFGNGYLLVRTKLPSFLVTLGTFLMLQGLNLAITKLVTGNVATNDISNMAGFGSAHAVFAADIRIGGVPVTITVFYWIVLVALATWVLLRTRSGNWIFAVGGNVDSARAVGVPVKATKIGLFMLVGFTCWLMGMHELFAFNTVQSGEGIGNELIYIIAAVVGGCLLTGGYGSAIGAGIGALIFGMTTEGIVYADWDPNWFKFFVGAMLLLATVVNTWVRSQAARKRTSS
jgi:simple sugar transport system permease protein